MLGAQQFYQAPYNDQSPWQQQENRIPYAQQTSKLQQDQHYTRIAVNQNHSSQNVNTRQTSGDNAQDGNGASLSALNQQGSPGMEQLSEENQKVLNWVAQLMDPAQREGALMELSKKREQVPELALILWHSFGVMTSLLQEIISVYPLLNPSQLTAAASNRVCNALALLQCVASHNETRGLFLNGMLPGMWETRSGTDLQQHTSHCSYTLSSTQLQNHVPSNTSALPHSASSALSSRMNPPLKLPSTPTATPTNHQATPRPQSPSSYRPRSSLSAFVLWKQAPSYQKRSPSSLSRRSSSTIQA